MIIDGLTISFDPIPSLLQEELSIKDFDTYLLLLERVQTKPKGICGEIEALHTTYPHIPEISNLLSYAYILHKEIAKAEALIKQAYHSHPDYLFAKLNYADLCLRKKQLDTVFQIFPSFDLKKLFPGRTTFHFTEYRGLQVLAAHTLLAQKKRDQALVHYHKAYSVDPAHPSVIFLEKKLSSPLKSQLQSSLRRKIALLTPLALTAARLLSQVCPRRRQPNPLAGSGKSSSLVRLTGSPALHFEASLKLLVSSQSSIFRARRILQQALKKVAQFFRIS